MLCMIVVSTFGARLVDILACPSAGQIRCDVVLHDHLDFLHT